MVRAAAEQHARRGRLCVMLINHAFSYHHYSATSPSSPSFVGMASGQRFNMNHDHPGSGAGWGTHVR
eukprot:4169294-Prorocentrum_lima.AAC.1